MLTNYHGSNPTMKLFFGITTDHVAEKRLFTAPMTGTEQGIKRKITFCSWR